MGVFLAYVLLIALIISVIVLIGGVCLLCSIREEVANREHV